MIQHVLLCSYERKPREYKTVAERCQTRAKDYDISKMAAGYNAVYKEITNE